ncbi:tail fiber protein [Paenibacillus sp. F411]|uniref:tail fiber protein n=1 Tax=Paenibacillus sp. F411 TaxID=2820239 RepID=UPI001FB8C3CA|nr:tail fiber protein [Paenibacillus sp. F411]
MSSFSAKGLTNKGRSLQAKAQAGAQLKYTKVVIGDGQLGGQSITALTNVISSKKTIDVTRLKMTPPNQATVGFVLSNQDVTTGFYFREIGVFAMDPDEGEILYYYLNAGDTADYIPPTGTGDLINKNFDVLVYVGQAQSVTLSVDTNLAYVTHKELDEALAGLDPDIPDASLTQKGLVQLSNATNGTRESVAATEKAVKAAYDEALAGKQLGVERKAEVVAALNSIGVTASTSETWAQLIPKISAVIRATGNATAAQVLSGSTFSNAGANGLVGTMPNRGAGGTVTPGTSNQTKDAGYYSSPITILGDPDLISSNLPKDVNIFNVQGLLERLTTTDRNAIISAIVSKGVPASAADSNAVLAAKISQIYTGKKTAEGSFTSTGANVVVPITGLDFTPRVIVVYNPGSRYAVYGLNGTNGAYDRSNRTNVFTEVGYGVFKFSPSDGGVTYNWLASE